MYAFITAVPITKLFAWGEGDTPQSNEKHAYEIYQQSTCDKFR
jgi:hypothetical protein